MTCALCGYEFCWACGGSAGSEDNHFSAFGGGCGIGMMTEGIKPGDGVEQNKCTKVLKIIGLVLLGIILYPFVLVLYMPFGGVVVGC